MTDEDRQWLERHGFIEHKKIEEQLCHPVFIKNPQDESNQMSIWIECKTHPYDRYWTFSIAFEYNGQSMSFKQQVIALTDDMLKMFIDRWNKFECPKMLEKMNKEYFIPEEMKK